MNVGDLVQFSHPSNDETEDRFVVIELRGPRVLVAIADWDGPIAPVAVYLASELKPCES